MKLKRPYRKIVYRKKINILLMQIVNRNLGDAVIADNAAYLIRQSFPLLERRHYALHRYDIQSEDYEMVKAADLIVFDGGGLIKYRQEDFHKYVPDILECAREYQIPVYFNSVGIEGYDGTDERCRRLEETLNFDCVKGITARDDIETLRRDYLHSDRIFTAPAVDAAVFTPEVYGIQKDAGSDVIGLGVVRYRIFEDYGIAQVTRKFQLDLWKNVALHLERQGLRWQIFVNGLRSDYEFAKEVLAYMGRESEAERLLAPRPAESRELTAQIASYKGLIACRMHSNIIAYALGIPSIGLVWNRKMIFWGERIGYPERFIESGQFEPEYIVQQLINSIAQGVRPCSSAMKKSVQAPLQWFIRRYGAQVWKKRRWEFVPKPKDWSGRLAAAALGGLQMQYINMNTPKGLEAAIDSGFRIFEADIRLTRDHRLVCVNGWTKGTYEKLGADPAAYDSSGMDYETFMNCRMYDGHFETMDAEQLFQKIRLADRDWKLILDIGKPNKEAAAVMTAQLQELCGRYGDEGLKEHLFIRLQSKRDVEVVQQARLPMQIMYYVPPKDKREEKKLTLDGIGKYCRKQGIGWVSMPKEALDEEVMAYLKKAKLKSCVFSYYRLTDVLYAQQLGADWTAVSYLPVDEPAGWHEQCWRIVIR